MYSFAKKALFMLSPETAHDVSLDGLSALSRLGALNLLPKPKSQKSVQVLGLDFPNAVGLAAGLDKNGDYIDALGAFGFGFIEVGTVTPRPQPGNEIPRLFRIPEKNAIINRMGFNNKGVDYLVERVKKAKYRGVIGINIGKNKSTPDEEAVNDYLYCLDRVYEVADYVVINLSSPNTPGLRNLQFGDHLEALITALQARQKELDESLAHTPILIKIAPDLTDDDVERIAETFNKLSVEGVIATNTTISRESIADHRFAAEAGGLSGSPVREQSNHVLKLLRRCLHEDIPIIGVGGILAADEAEEKIQLGADLVQIYSGFIFEGPSLVKKSIERLARR